MKHSRIRANGGVPRRGGVQVEKLVARRSAWILDDLHAAPQYETRLGFLDVVHLLRSLTTAEMDCYQFIYLLKYYSKCIVSLRTMESARGRSRFHSRSRQNRRRKCCRGRRRRGSGAGGRTRGRRCRSSGT